MTKTRSTKAALLSSVLALFLCVTMLLGTTFAWFTDSVTSANNIIKSGNLDVELYYMNDEVTTWTKVTNTTNVFKDGAKWEPGHTEVVKLKVVNEGTLALKYQLGVNVASEVGSVNADGKDFKLSDFIKFGIADGALTGDRDAAIAAVEANATPLRKSYSSEVTALEATNEKVVTMVVYMPTSVGNEANAKKGAATPTINLGINVFATQNTVEADSFDDQYDVDAPFSVWNGTVPTEMPASLVVDGATQTVHVKDADAFAYLSTLSTKWVELYTDGNGTTYTNYANGAGANYYYSGKWSVSLEADIDLDNHALAPVDIKFGQGTGATAFNGNNHTIRNINATTGLFADGTRSSFSNLVLENVKATNGALAGAANHFVSNVTVKNANIFGVDYVGGLVGKTYSRIEGCEVIDSSVVATGKEAGGLVGYAEANSNGSVITANVVKNVTVYAGNRAAGLVAQVNVNVKVYNNIIDTVNVNAADKSQYQPGAVVSNALAPENVYDNTVKNANVDASIAAATDTTTLNAAIADGAETIFVGEGTYTFPAGNLKSGMTVICDEDTVFDGKTGFNINGATVVGATFTNDNDYVCNSTIINGTFKDCVFTDCDGLRYCYAGDSVVFENCVFDTDFYGVHFDGGANDVVFKNCSFTGFNAFGSAVTKLTMENCTFKYNGKGGYNGVNLWGNSELINCTFVFDGSASYEWVDLCGDNKTVTFDGCVISDGTTERALESADVGDYGTGNTITIK